MPEVLIHSFNCDKVHLLSIYLSSIYLSFYPSIYPLSIIHPYIIYLSIHPPINMYISIYKCVHIYIHHNLCTYHLFTLLSLNNLCISTVYAFLFVIINSYLVSHWVDMTYCLRRYFSITGPLWCFVFVLFLFCYSNFWYFEHLYISNFFPKLELLGQRT